MNYGRLGFVFCRLLTVTSLNLLSPIFKCYWLGRFMDASFTGAVAS